MRQTSLSFKKVENILFYLLILFLPTQLGKHFWPDFSVVNGLRIDYLSPTFYFTDLLVGLLFVTWLVNKVQSEEFKVKSFSQKVKMVNFKLAIGLLVFLIINIILSQNATNGIYHLLKFLEFFFLAYYAAAKFVTIQQMKMIFFLLGIGVVFESFLAIAQFINQASIGGLLYYLGERTFTAMTPGIANASINGELLLRAYGTFSHPNVLAGYLLIGMIFLLFSLPWVHKGVEKIFWIFTLLIGSSALLLTMSRLAFILWISILVGVFFFVSLRGGTTKQSNIRLPRFLWSLAMTFIVGTIFLLATPFGVRLLQTNIGEESVIQREVLIRASGVLFMQQPSIGIGLGNFIPKLATIQEPLSSGLYLQPVHSIYLLVLVETGIIGLGFFIWFLVKTYKQLFTAIRISTQIFPYRIFLVALTVILILGLFDHYWLTLQQGQLLFALVFGLSWTKI